jgi:hypothetical protein
VPTYLRVVKRQGSKLLKIVLCLAKIVSLLIGFRAADRRLITLSEIRVQTTGQAAGLKRIYCLQTEIGVNFYVNDFAKGFAMTKMFFLFVSIFFLLQTGCTTSRVVEGSDGSGNYLLTCIDPIFCNEKAEALCDGSYKILSTNERIESFQSHMLVKCEHKFVEVSRE